MTDARLDAGADAPGLTREVQEQLRRLESVTDVALSRLDLAALVTEVLQRIRELLQADAAAVLTVDESRRFVTSHVAEGFDSPTLPNGFNEIGTGFVGRVVKQRRPAIVANVATGDIVHPDIQHLGLRSLAGVPRLRGGQVLGALYVGTVLARAFSDSDVRLLQLAAERVAAAMLARRSFVDHSAAEALQRSLAPRRLPEVPGFDFAGRYIPGSQYGVGGDWYDVFTLPDGVLGIVMGDVMGHGLRAATVMGRLKSALRAYALEGEDPATVLRRLDRKIQHFEPGQMGTVLYGVLDPAVGEVRLSSAGHPHPLLAVPGGVSEVDLPYDLPLGADLSVPRHSATVQLPVGSMLCLFTDGLVERRGAELDGRIAVLRSALVPTASAEDASRLVIEKMIDGKAPQDDVALVLVKRTGDLGGE